MNAEGGPVAAAAMPWISSAPTPKPNRHQRRGAAALRKKNRKLIAKVGPEEAARRATIKGRAR